MKTTDRWRKWRPSAKIIGELLQQAPPKPSKATSGGFEGAIPAPVPIISAPEHGSASEDFDPIDAVRQRESPCTDLEDGIEIRFNDDDSITIFRLDGSMECLFGPNPLEQFQREPPPELPDAEGPMFSLTAPQRFRTLARLLADGLPANLKPVFDEAYAARAAARAAEEKHDE
jgi:hypothetical protein